METNISKKISKLSKDPTQESQREVWRLKWIISLLSFSPILMFIDFLKEEPVILLVYGGLSLVNHIILAFERGPYKSFLKSKELIYKESFIKKQMEFFYRNYNEIIQEKEESIEKLNIPSNWYKNNNFSSKFMNLSRSLIRKDIMIIEKFEDEYCLGG